MNEYIFCALIVTPLLELVDSGSHILSNRNHCLIDSRAIAEYSYAICLMIFRGEVLFLLPCHPLSGRHHSILWGLPQRLESRREIMQKWESRTSRVETGGGIDEKGGRRVDEWMRPNIVILLYSGGMRRREHCNEILSGCSCEYVSVRI